MKHLINLTILMVWVNTNAQKTGYVNTSDHIVVSAIEKNYQEFTDTRDNKSYKTIQINDQIWMAENLNYFAGEGSWYYNNDSVKYSPNGCLYNWKTATKVCPSGWHLPSDSEWKNLEISTGMDTPTTNLVGSRGTDQGTRLKKGGDIGLNIILAGYRLWWDGTFHYENMYGDYWSSTSENNDEAWYRNFGFNDPAIYRNCQNKNYGMSVRCVKD